MLLAPLKSCHSLQFFNFLILYPHSVFLSSNSTLFLCSPFIIIEVVSLFGHLLRREHLNNNRSRGLIKAKLVDYYMGYNLFGFLFPFSMLYWYFIDVPNWILLFLKLQCGVDVSASNRVLLQSSKPSLHANVDSTALVAAIVSRQISVVRLLLQVTLLILAIDLFFVWGNYFAHFILFFGMEKKVWKQFGMF